MRKIFIFVILSAVLFTSNATAKVITSVKTSYYSVSGKTGKAIFKSILRRGPKVAKTGHVIASTTISMKIGNIKIAQKRGRCVVSNANVLLYLRYRYPKLSNKKRHSKRLRKAWQKLIKKIRIHELKHGKIAKQLAKDVDRSIRRLSGKVSRKCKNFGRGAERNFKRLVSKSHARHARFDRSEARSRSRMTRLQKALFFAK